MKYRANKKMSHQCNVDAYRIRTKKNMSPSPSVGDIILETRQEVLKKGVEEICGSLNLQPV